MVENQRNISSDTLLYGIRWVWFDLDDTLYDFSRSSLAALRHIYEQYELSRLFSSLEAWIDLYHLHNHRLWDLYNRGDITQASLRRDRFLLPLTEAGMAADEANALWPRMDADYLHQLAMTGLTMPHAIDTLEHLRAMGFRIGVISNGFVGVQEEKLRSSGLDRLVDCLVLSDEIGVNKPDGRLFDYALQKAGATASESILIGDNPDTDIAGAIAAGWRAALYTREADNPDPTLSRAPYPIIKSLKMVK